MMDTALAQLRKGAVEICLLAQIERMGESYGYELFKSFESYQSMAMTESTLYPALARLHKKGLLEMRKVAGSQGPPRRYYSLTLAGRARYEQLKIYWCTLNIEVEEITARSSSAPQKMASARASHEEVS